MVLTLTQYFRPLGSEVNSREQPVLPLKRADLTDGFALHSVEDRYFPKHSNLESWTPSEVACLSHRLTVSRRYPRSFNEIFLDSSAFNGT